MSFVTSKSNAGPMTASATGASTVSPSVVAATTHQVSCGPAWRTTTVISGRTDVFAVSSKNSSTNWTETSPERASPAL